MSFLDFFLGEKKKTARVAKERLQIILAHERSGRTAPDYLPALQRDLVAVISKYVKINPEDIVVNLERQDNLDVLEVKIELPEKNTTPASATRQPQQRPAQKAPQPPQPQQRPQPQRQQQPHR